MARRLEPAMRNDDPWKRKIETAIHEMDELKAYLALIQV
jgi:hypothetical protein